MTWQPFVAMNLALILTTGGILWYKFHKLRIMIENEFRELRNMPPPILIGETFLAERFEHLEQLTVELRVRLDEIERALHINGDMDKP